METMPSISSRSLQYYVIAKKWSSDLEFLRLETGFLRQLLDRYTVRLQSEAHIRQLVGAGKALQELEGTAISDLLSRQLTQLELMAEDVIPEDTEALAEVQVKPENLMGELTRRYRSAKQDIFRLVLDSHYDDLYSVNSN